MLARPGGSGLVLLGAAAEVRKVKPLPGPGFATSTVWLMAASRRTLRRNIQEQKTSWAERSGGGAFHVPPPPKQPAVEPHRPTPRKLGSANPAGSSDEPAKRTAATRRHLSAFTHKARIWFMFVACLTSKYLTAASELICTSIPSQMARTRWSRFFLPASVHGWGQRATVVRRTPVPIDHKSHWQANPFVGALLL